MNFKSNKGFSLIEIAVSLSVLSILLLAVPNIMLNMETIKNKYEYEIVLDRQADKIIDKAISDTITDQNQTLIENDIYYSINKTNYNEDINKFIFTFSKNKYKKKYVLLKTKP